MASISKTESAEGQGRGDGKRTAEPDDDEPQPKLQCQESPNEAKLKKSTKRKLDVVLSKSHPNAVVHEEYTCMLNQTNIAKNINKFYVIQVVKDEEKYFVLTRWGRVGENGREDTKPFNNKQEATKAFEKIFREKTKNKWADRENFVAAPKKYTLLEMGDEKEDTLDSDEAKMEEASSSDSCSLHPRTQLMIKLIFSGDLVGMPLGKLSDNQIQKGLGCLSDIEEAIKGNKPQDTLRKLSSDFYSFVPHTFGRRQVPPMIDTIDLVQQKEKELLDIELTQKVTTGALTLLQKYEMLNSDLAYIEKASSEFKLLNEYTTACPNSRKGRLLDAWTVDRNMEKDRFMAHDDITHRKLLWYSTRVAEVAAILKMGLRISKNSGDLLGKGIYFTSEYAEASEYVGIHPAFKKEKKVGFMFLVEVALGKECSMKKSDSTLTEAPSEFDSVVGRGRSEPDPQENKKVDFDGREVIVPVGKPVPQEEWSESEFCRSKYVVYKESQLRIRYLLKFTFE